jgi:hypothetical protein
MTTTTTRARPTSGRRAPAQPLRGRTPGRDHADRRDLGRRDYDRGDYERRELDRLRGYTDGANALRLDVLDPIDYEPEPEPARPANPRQVNPAGLRAPGTRTRAVAPPAPVAVPRAPFLALVLTIVVLGVLGILVINTKINENAFQLDDLRHGQALLDQQEQQLAEQLAERESPGNLAAAARRLGLVPAQQPAFLHLPDGKVLGAPQPATGSVSSAATSSNPGAGQ